MDIINKPENIESYLEERIIEYLRSQRDVPEYYGFQENNLDQIQDQQKALDIVEELLNDLLYDVDRTILFQQKYQETQKEHHQYGLFNLSDILPEFHIDNNVIRQLCFRETLLIGNVDEPSSQLEGVKPLSVGGMCLKVELAKGMASTPFKTEKEIDMSIKEKIRKLKAEMAEQTNNATGTSEPNDNDSDKEKLKKYEQFLEEEAAKTPPKFVVHLSTEFDLNGHNAGSRIVSWVDQEFHTLEERRKEYILKHEKNLVEQVLYFSLQEHKYYVKHVSNMEEEHESRKYYPLSKTLDLVGEGANFILMRYLAISRYKGTFELSTMYINGDMCRNIYECKGPKPAIVNGAAVDVCKIYRTIMEECGIVHISVTVLTVYGMLISQEWSGCPYIIHLNPQLVTNGKPTKYDFIALKKIWETDMELVSKYLDCKTNAEKKMKTYIKDHSEIQDMMSDYLQSILLLKPENVMPFTIDYFMHYEPYKLPQLPYFDDASSRNHNEDTGW